MKSSWAVQAKSWSWQSDTFQSVRLNLSTRWLLFHKFNYRITLKWTLEHRLTFIFGFLKIKRIQKKILVIWQKQFTSYAVRLLDTLKITFFLSSVILIKAFFLCLILSLHFSASELFSDYFLYVIHVCVKSKQKIFRLYLTLVGFILCCKCTIN